MTAHSNTMNARRYLLGIASDEESASIEQAYFGRDKALDAVETAEEELIEDYLEGQLANDDRVQFERHYLATPGHRVRVETIRRLKTAVRPTAAPIPFVPRTLPQTVFSLRAGTFGALAWAAGLVIAVGGGLWLVERGRPTPEPGTTTPTAPIGPATPALPVPRVFAMVLSPVAVRSAGDSPTLVIPAGTDLVDLRLEGEAGDKPLVRGRVVIRTVSGDEIWQGPTAAALNAPAGVIARTEVPAARLHRDDYVVALYEISATGAESERTRYFLRVRPPSREN